MSSSSSPFCLSLGKCEIRFGFVDLKQKKPRESGTEAAHIGVSSGREQEMENRKQEWEKESKKEVSGGRG